MFRKQSKENDSPMMIYIGELLCFKPTFKLQKKSINHCLFESKSYQSRSQTISIILFL